MKVALIVDSTQLYTQTVLEHVQALLTFSEHDVHRIDFRDVISSKHGLEDFDALIHHYSIRICFPYYPQKLLDKEASFRGMKFLFIQDEYDFVNLASSVINYIGFDVVFSCVPPQHIDWVYSGVDRKVTSFVHVLTGYASASTPIHSDAPIDNSRALKVSYRGRDIGVRYGELGRIKVDFPKVMHEACTNLGIPESIAWTEADRLYGEQWLSLLQQSSVILGTPSGSNVFDFNGKLPRRVRELQREGWEDTRIYDFLIAPLERPGTMNQISPRIFEALEQGCALCLIEDEYSGLLRPDEHYFAVRNDYSNLDEVLDQLQDSRQVYLMHQRAYDELVRSGNYTYSSMARRFDQVVNQLSSTNWSSVYASGTSKGLALTRSLASTSIKRVQIAYLWQPRLLISRIPQVISVSKHRARTSKWRMKNAIRVRFYQMKGGRLRSVYQKQSRKHH